MKPPNKPIDKTNLASRVYSEIRESLIAGRYMPSDRLRINETAQMFGTSDTPVREALLRLVSEHALEMETAKQIAVPPLGLARYIEIRTVRLALESAAVEVAASNIGARDIAELVRINKKFTQAEFSHNAEQQLRYNREFHFGIYVHCRLPTLLAMIENMWTSMGPILRAFYEKSGGTYDQGHGQHDLLLAALEKHDPAAAVKAIRADLMSAAPSIERFLKEYQASQEEQAAA
ncbi:MAG: GntR family transcriptional regulator [Polaromonas sp.]|uniref:GntR family transcriptional regulator n=1 Tax=Polaromonas sp. TaxID=1869339 RepID=UPI0027342E1A|nr:GntR family transcriptional regulator [Polaromonas sp.]MDP3799775.1 GntR family transcriptional regulator [Polaromonas sp.]